MNIKIILMFTVLALAFKAYSAENDQIWSSFKKNYCGEEKSVAGLCGKSNSYPEFESNLKKYIQECSKNDVKIQNGSNPIMNLETGLPKSWCDTEGNSLKKLYKAYFAGAKFNACKNTSGKTPSHSATAVR
jgi:hypothetical protein